MLLEGLLRALGQWHCVGLIPVKMWGESVCLLICGFTQLRRHVQGNSSVQFQRQCIRGASEKNVDGEENKSVFSRVVDTQKYVEDKQEEKAHTFFISLQNCNDLQMFS